MWKIIDECNERLKDKINQDIQKHIENDPNKQFNPMEHVETIEQNDLLTNQDPESKVPLDQPTPELEEN